MIGIIDSGIGGKGIEKEIRKLLPNAPIYYLADTKNFPYGSKKVVELHGILENNINLMLKRGIDIVVLACNSATVSSVKQLRRKFNIPIVGVEPAIKSAAKLTKTNNIAIFSTPITANSMAENNLIKKYCKGIKVYKIAFPNLASWIEKRDNQKYTSEVSSRWEEYRDYGIDVIVLGCTHYTLIKKELQKIVGHRVKIIDSNKAVARQVKRIYDKIS